MSAATSLGYPGPSLALNSELDHLKLEEVVQYVQAHVKEACRLVRHGARGLRVLTPSAEERDAVIGRWHQVLANNFPPDRRSPRPGIGALSADSDSFRALDRLFDALVETCRTLMATEVNPAELLAWCGALAGRTWRAEEKDDVVRNQETALCHFVGVFVSSVPGVASMPDAKARLLPLCQSCLRQAHRWQEELGAAGPGEEARTRDALGEADRDLRNALTTLLGVTFLSHSEADEDDSRTLARTLVHRALAIQRLAANDQCRWPGNHGSRPSHPDREAPRSFQELCRRFVQRAGGEEELKQQITDEWAALIGALKEYKEASSKGGGVKTELTRGLVDGMFRLLEEKQSTPLQEAAQRLVKERLKKPEAGAAMHDAISETSVRHAASDLFLPAVENVLRRLRRQAPTHTMPAAVDDDVDITDMISMLKPVVAKQNEIMLTEYSIYLHEEKSPDLRLPVTLILEDGKEETGEEYKRVPELLLGAKIAGQYRLDLHIAAGAYGDGWRAQRLDQPCDATISAKAASYVCVKTFRPAQAYRKPRYDSSIEALKRSMRNELATAHRIRNVDLLKYRHIVQVIDVLRGVRITTSTAKEDTIHCLVMEYVDGGELFNYVSGKPTFTEPQARFLVRQLFQLVHRLHNHATQPAYYHGDLKLENIVVDFAGPDLKLIDYGTLRPVLSGTTVTHVTERYRKPHPQHTEPQSVDLYPVGIILKDLLSGENGYRGTGTPNLERLVQKLQGQRRNLLKTTDFLDWSGEDGDEVVWKDDWLKDSNVEGEEELRNELRRRYSGISDSNGGMDRYCVCFDLIHVKEGETIPKEVREAATDDLRRAIRGALDVLNKDGPDKWVNEEKAKDEITVSNTCLTPCNHCSQLQAQVPQDGECYVCYVEKLRKGAVQSIPSYTVWTGTHNKRIGGDDQPGAWGQEVLSVCLRWERGSDSQAFYHFTGLVKEHLRKTYPTLKSVDAAAVTKGPQTT
uniref:Protein kinase domain-containing protein n=1 Tax=Eutreptiella gymnastica TaxID=73025 RepID=A0A7S1IPB3_9EUGL